MPWEGPYKLRELLDRVGGADPSLTIFPETYGLYVFSLEPWEQEPAGLLYLGSGHATKNTNMRHRMGAEVASALGFWGKVAGHGHGGILLSKYCRLEGDKSLRASFRLACPAKTKTLVQFLPNKTSSVIIILRVVIPRCSSDPQGCRTAEGRVTAGSPAARRSLSACPERDRRWLADSYLFARWIYDPQIRTRRVQEIHSERS